MKWKIALYAALFAALVLGSVPASAQDRYPSKRLNWTIAFGPGGGNDIMSRTLISVLEKYKLYPETIVAENRAGGSGAVGWGYVFSQKGNKQIIGGKVVQGVIKNRAQLEVMRKEAVLGRGKVLNLQTQKQDVNEAEEGKECGLLFDSGVTVQVGDHLVA